LKVLRRLQILAATEPQKAKHKMPKDELLSELERQEKYLAELPENFSFPLFNTKRALIRNARTPIATQPSRRAEYILGKWQLGGATASLNVNCNRVYPMA
jgi:hypothetical protein